MDTQEDLPLDDALRRCAILALLRVIDDAEATPETVRRSATTILKYTASPPTSRGNGADPDRTNDPDDPDDPDFDPNDPSSSAAAIRAHYHEVVRGVLEKVGAQTEPKPKPDDHPATVDPKPPTNPPRAHRRAPMVAPRPTKSRKIHSHTRRAASSPSTPIPPPCSPCSPW